ncbi:M29 family aminopeptidase T, partial [Escherichia coli]|nr:M29 family aminopeptidase T [Escherichia coli]
RDARIEKLAHNLINYSVKLGAGEKVLIENFGVQKELVMALVEEAYKAGGFPFVSLKEPQIDRAMMLGADSSQYAKIAEFEGNVMKEMDAYIGLRAGDNINETSDVPADKLKIHGETVGKMHSDIRVKQTKWVVLRYPSSSMAQLAKMSTAGFEDFY